MTNKDFSTTILVDQSPATVFEAVKNVRGWWSKNAEGNFDKVNDVFVHTYKDAHRCTIKVTEVVPDQKIVWHVLDNYFSFTQDETEWKDTKIVFDIAKKGEKTELRFTHRGLTSAYECYDACSTAWTNLIQETLPRLIASGNGKTE
jgi:hypothetical protein